MSRDKYVKLISKVSFLEENLFLLCQPKAFGKLTKNSVSCLLHSRFHRRYSTTPKPEVEITCEWEQGYTVYAILKDGVLLKHPRSDEQALPVLVHITLPAFNSLMAEGPLQSISLRFVKNGSDIVLVSQKMIEGLVQRSESDYVEDLKIGSQYLVEDLKGPHLFLGPNENLTYQYWASLQNGGALVYLPSEQRATTQISEDSVSGEEVEYFKLVNLKGRQTVDVGEFTHLPWERFWKMCPFLWNLSSRIVVNRGLEVIEVHGPASSWTPLLDLIEQCGRLKSHTANEDLRALTHATNAQESCLSLYLSRQRSTEWEISLYGRVNRCSYARSYILNCSPLELRDQLTTLDMPDTVAISVFIRNDNVVVPCA